MDPDATYQHVRAEGNAAAQPRPLCYKKIMKGLEWLRNLKKFVKWL